MAGMHLQPMQTFDFLQPAQWPKWKQRFEQFRVASGLIDRSEGRQISTLLYSMGPEAQDVLETTGIDEENRGVYDAVIASFDEYFGVRRNIIFERAQFNSRKQQPGESAEQYILALYTLAGRCGYASREQKEQDIRDRLVIGIRDAQLSKRLQLTADLDLTKAKKMILQTEAVQETQKLSAGDSRENPIEVDALQGTRSRRGDSRRSNFRRRPQPTHHQSDVRCTRCGREPHGRAECPARDATCHRCRKRGHFESQCRTKNISHVTTNDESSTGLPDCDRWLPGWRD